MVIFCPVLSGSLGQIIIWLFRQPSLTIVLLKAFDFTENTGYLFTYNIKKN